MHHAAPRASLAAACCTQWVLLASCAAAPSSAGPAAKSATSTAQAATRAELPSLHTPQPGQLVHSPLRVAGEARRTWFFEASFPIRLLDANGRTLAQTPAHAQADWMTSERVPFEAELQFTPPTTELGTLVLQRDNPSGLPEHDAELRVPVRFVRQ